MSRSARSSNSASSRRARPTSIRGCRRPANGTRPRAMRCCSPPAGWSTAPDGSPLRYGKRAFLNRAFVATGGLESRRGSSRFSSRSRAAATCPQGSELGLAELPAGRPRRTIPSSHFGSISRRMSGPIASAAIAPRARTASSRRRARGFAPAIAFEHAEAPDQPLRLRRWRRRARPATARGPRRQSDSGGSMHIHHSPGACRLCTAAYRRVAILRSGAEIV